ncbi:hypothetical protein LXA47_08345 [Massilia sp. P8910]|uniref:hypothetical protein n=1 Tax=Massilia antarctica TaxID=2765360 RepID=UPI001E2FF09D|nr:hypothetical protein [Massilia antarctica]MCE3603615.1 hypothetical protein [Massilia antarctica]
MLRSLTSQLEVHLHSTHLAVAKTRLGSRKEERHVIPVEDTSKTVSAGWKAALIALDIWLETSRQNGASIEFIASDHFSHYGLIPWSPDVQSADELNALGRAALHALYGPLSNEWEIQVEYSGYGGAGLACAMERSLITEIIQLCDKHALRLKKIQPLFTRILSLLRNEIGKEGLIAVVEHNRCVLACIHHGAWHSVRALSVSRSPSNALDVLIERELILQGLDANLAIRVQSVAQTNISTASRFPNAVLANHLPWLIPASMQASAEQPAEA